MNGKLPTGPSQCDFPVNMPIGREPQRAKHARGIELKQNIELPIAVSRAIVTI